MSIADHYAVADFLKELHLEQYTDILVNKGYSRFTDIADLNETDLDELSISDASHREKLLAAAVKYGSCELMELREWLQKHGLDYYYVQFINNDYTNLSEIANLNVEKTLYDNLEIVLPGHKKRLRSAVNEVKKRRRLEERTETPIAYGYWGKPSRLEDAKNLFLCVSATIQSTKNDKQASFEFMVDSGSDVVTISEDALAELDLELLGTITSRGVHTSKSKQLYKAKLVIGTEVIEIEVMGEVYASVGNHVLRHFHHYITRDKHIWLKGKGDAIPLPWTPSKSTTPSAQPQQATAETSSSTAASSSIPASSSTAASSSIPYQTSRLSVLLSPPNQRAPHKFTSYSSELKLNYNSSRVNSAKRIELEKIISSEHL
ncbi:uncharacterized protein LOC141902078 [Tubulanus polymorphus]|uniref:uncharacterized protein LOC141902078 n=1 Tax=Tubulanus polymorphus TaxID=672921 RepID=UPI003DA26229